MVLLGLSAILALLVDIDLEVLNHLKEVDKA
jgi:hypothetical protein